MVNSYGSWHDSDDVDSDIEQQAYNLLYYENFNNSTDVTENLEKNVSSSDIVSVLNKSHNNDCENLKFQSDSEEITINLLNSSDLNTDCKKYSDSESDDDDRYIPRVRCSNITGTICVGSSSDSDFEMMNATMDTSEPSLQMNFISEEESSLIKKSVSFSVENHPNDLSKVDKLFFSSKHTDDDWIVDFHPLKRSKFSNRYFESNSKSICSICTKKGHSDEQCTRSGPVCILCGKEGHMSKRCESVVCFACFQGGHSTKTCPSVKKFLSLGCRRCGQRGHLEEICPDVWRQYKYTVTPGPPIFQRFSSQNKTTVFCANCAKSGHFTEQCPRNRMNSKFLGPPPIMEIIKYDDFDIYQKYNLKYTKSFEVVPPVNDKSSDSTVEFPSFIENMNVTSILDDIRMMSDYEDEVDSSLQDSKNSQFGDGFIMLSPIINSKPTEDTKKPKLSKTNRLFPNNSTPRQTNNNKISPPTPFITTPATPTRLPGITTELLKKLFPEETNNMEKLPPQLRKKLRKKLKNFIDNGYLPGDSNMTQDRMEFWLQEISTGRALNYREKKKLLGSVSAALHCISDRVSTMEIAETTPEISTTTTTAFPKIDIIKNESEISIPEKRKRRNKFTRQAKNLKNSLKISKKEKQKIVKSEEMENSIKTRLRKSSITVVGDDGDGGGDIVKRKKMKRRKRKSAPVKNEAF